MSNVRCGTKADGRCSHSGGPDSELR
jgi:hypothetical protein